MNSVFHPLVSEAPVYRLEWRATKRGMLVELMMLTGLHREAGTSFHQNGAVSFVSHRLPCASTCAGRNQLLYARTHIRIWNSSQFNAYLTVSIYGDH
jgi:hypothetical protein